MAVALDTGELAARHERVFAKNKTLTPSGARACTGVCASAADRKPSRSDRRAAAAVRLRPADRHDRQLGAHPSVPGDEGAGGGPGAPDLAERARQEEWSYERFAEALLSDRGVLARSPGGAARIRAARFPAHKTLEEFDFTFQRSVKKQVIEHLGQLDFLHAENVILLGPPDLVSHCFLSITLGQTVQALRGEPRFEGLFVGLG